MDKFLLFYNLIYDNFLQLLDMIFDNLHNKNYYLGIFPFF